MKVKTDRSPLIRVVLWRRAALLCAAVWLLLTACYCGNRLLAPSRAVTVYGDTAANLVAATEAPSLLRVGALNIAHGRGTAESNWDGGTKEERHERLRQIAAFLREQKLDVVVLNEVDFDACWSGGVNQAEFLAREAGFPFRAEQRNYDFAVPFLSFRFGNAILSKYPLAGAKLIEYPAFRQWEAVLAGKKMGMACTIELSQDCQMRMLAVHLSHRSEAVRIESARLIARECRASRMPVVAAGDFNSAPADSSDADPDPSSATALSLLLDEGLTTVREAPVGADFTFPSTQPDRVLDWILVSPSLEVLATQAPAVVISDHRPVVATIAVYGAE